MQRMIEIKLNGKPFSPQKLEDAVVQAAAENLRVKLGSIRHPVTGEFPTIAITGSSLADLKIQVEGSPELVALVHEHLAGSEENGPETMEPQAESAEHK